MEVWIWVYSVMVHGRSATPDHHHLFTSAGAVDNFAFFPFKHAAPLTATYPDNAQRENGDKFKWLHTVSAGSKCQTTPGSGSSLPTAAKYKRLMESKTLIYRRPNCAIRIVDAHKQIQRHKCVITSAMETSARAPHRRNTLFTESSAGVCREQLFLLLSLWRRKRAVEDHSAADRPTQAPRKPRSFPPAFALIPAVSTHATCIKNTFIVLLNCTEILENMSHKI